VIPASFQTRRVLRVLNIPAVALSLAAVVAAVFARAFSAGQLALITGIPTLLVGALWARVLRSPKTVGNTSFRWGWAASMPLAMLNAGLAGGLLFAFDRSSPSPAEFFVGALMGASIGAIFWVPALFATLLCFGVPIAWAQRLAKKGLAGEERGEWIVGLVCAVMSVVAMLVSLGIRDMDTVSSLAGVWMTRAFALLGGLAGATATGLSLARESRRRRFVADAEAGKVAGYRVDPTDEGKVLVRVVSQGKGYRVADFEEEVFELDAQGEAMRPKEMREAVPE
jgi:hypothetical protein